MTAKDNIAGKSILMIGDPFYGYCRLIRKQLLRLGAESVLYIEAPFYRGSLRDSISIRNILSWLMNPWKRTQWTKELIDKIGDRQFDTFFVIENMPFKKTFMDYLRTKNPNIRMILFLWDTLKTQQSRYIDYLEKFDTVYSFDRDDANNYKLNYYPDFYIENEQVPIEDCTYDIAFVGAMNRKETFYRADALFKIYSFCEMNHLSYFLYLRHDKFPNSRSWLKGLFYMINNRRYNKKVNELRHYGFMHDTPLSVEESNKIMANSRVILDLSYPDRQGMTLNAIMALASGKKLITTNKRIMEESFYNPQMICVIDAEDPSFDMEFCNYPSILIDVSYLRLDKWVQHVVNELV